MNRWLWKSHDCRQFRTLWYFKRLGTVVNRLASCHVSFYSRDSCFSLPHLSFLCIARCLFVRHVVHDCRRGERFNVGRYSESVFRLDNKVTFDIGVECLLRLWHTFRDCQRAMPPPRVRRVVYVNRGAQRFHCFEVASRCLFCFDQGRDRFPSRFRMFLVYRAPFLFYRHRHRRNGRNCLSNGYLNKHRSCLQSCVGVEANVYGTQGK